MPSVVSPAVLALPAIAGKPKNPEDSAKTSNVAVYRVVEKKPFVDSPMLRSENFNPAPPMGVVLAMVVGIVVVMSIIYKAVTSEDKP